MHRRLLLGSVAAGLALSAGGCGEDSVAPPAQLAPGGVPGPPSGMEPPSGPFASVIAFLRLSSNAQDIWTVDGGEVQVTTTGTVVEHDWSPDGQQIVFENGTGDAAEIYVVSGEGGNAKQLTNNPDDARNIDPEWAPVGGSIVFVSNRATGNFQIWKMDKKGNDQTQLTETGSNGSPTWSPDATKIAFFSFRPGFTDREILVMNADGSNETRLTMDGGEDVEPRWSPDGNRIAFRRQDPSTSNIDIWVMDSDGMNPMQLTNDVAEDRDHRWSPDGTKIVFTKNRGDDAEVWVMDSDGSDQVNLTNNGVIDEDPWWSPDGTMIAFKSRRDGNQGIFVMNADGGGQTRLTNNEGQFEGEPRWRP